MNSNAFDLLLAPPIRGWSLGFLAVAVAWALLTTAARCWRRMLDRERKPWSAVEPGPTRRSSRPRLVWGGRTATHA